MTRYQLVVFLGMIGIKESNETKLWVVRAALIVIIFVSYSGNLLVDRDSFNVVAWLSHSSSCRWRLHS